MLDFSSSLPHCLCCLRPFSGCFFVASWEDSQHRDRARTSQYLSWASARALCRFVSEVSPVGGTNSMSPSGQPGNYNRGYLPAPQTAASRSQPWSPGLLFYIPGSSNRLGYDRLGIGAEFIITFAYASLSSRRSVTFVIILILPSIYC